MTRGCDVAGCNRDVASPDVVGDLVDWLNGNSGAVQAVATVVLVGLTGWYAHTTKRTLDAGQRPYLYLEMVPTSMATVELRIGNAGPRAAERIRFEVVQDTIGPGPDPWGSEPPFSTGLDYLAPGAVHRFRQFIDSGAGWDKPGTNVFEVSISYRWGRRKFDQTTRVDAASLAGVDFETDPMKPIARALRKLADQPGTERRP